MSVAPEYRASASHEPYFRRFALEKHFSLEPKTLPSGKATDSRKCVFWRFFIGREAAQVNLFVQLISSGRGQSFANMRHSAHNPVLLNSNNSANITAAMARLKR